MKKLRKVGALIALVGVMSATLVGCGKSECDGCGEKKKCKKYEYFGEEVNLCKSCHKDMESLMNMSW